MLGASDYAVKRHKGAISVRAGIRAIPTGALIEFLGGQLEPVEAEVAPLAGTKPPAG